MKRKDQGGFLYAFNITAVVLILFFAALIPLLHAAGSYAKSVQMHIGSEDGTSALYVPTSFAITIRNASSTPLNAAEFELHFDPTALFVTKITPLPTLCEDRFVIKSSIDNVNGTVLFQCGTVTPFSAATGTIALIAAIPMRTGTSSLEFGTATHVLAHDGYGTDATASTTGVSFNTI